MRKLFVALVLTLFSLTLSSAAGQNSQSSPQASTVPGLVFGTAWYPEQWDESRWEKDLSLMQAAGINMVRVAEFAWSRMEPSEGQFDFVWLDRAIDAAGKHGMKVVLGTPSAAPPAWLTQKYPGTLATWESGLRATHGNREHYRFTSERYLQLARRMAEQMAKRYGHNPNVIGWQIDNEYGPVSYDDETRQKFQQYLKARYKTLDTLNERWSTNYWSEAYDNWEEIPIPIGGHNPGLMLEWKHFVTQTIRDYQHNQIEVIRANSEPRQFITHNYMGFDGNFDHYIVSEELDIASYDYYIGQGHPDPLYSNMANDLTRGFKRKNFWIMETQPGAVNWARINNTLDKGEVREMAWSDIGHGADAVSYWQWRSAPNGQEQYHGTLLGADGNPRPLYDEVAQVGREFAKLSAVLRGTSPTPQTAILHDYNSRWAIDFQRHNRDFDPVQYLFTFYRPLRQMTQDVDVVSPTAPLSQYKLVVAPALNVLPEATAQHLAEYVKNGGHLVIGARSGMKDEYNTLLPSRQPGDALNRLLAGDVAEFYALDKPVPVNGKVGNGEARIWAELLETKDPSVEVLLSYGKSNGWLDGKPSVITRHVGSGQITYVGAQLDDAVMDGIARRMIADSGVKPVFGPVPTGVDVSRRVGNGKEVFVLVNYTAETQTIPMPRSMRELLKDTVTASTLTLDPHGVAVLVPAQ